MVFLLMAQFETPLIPIAKVGEFLGMSEHQINAQASKHLLPFPVIKLSDSQKAPRFVRIEDLATHIDSQAEKAKTVWKRNQL
jgi:hypothetical protein